MTPAQKLAKQAAKRRDAHRKRWLRALRQRESWTVEDYARETALLAAEIAARLESGVTVGPPAGWAGGHDESAFADAA